MFWVAWISGPLGATLLFALFSFLALREFITLMHTQRSDHCTLIVAFFVLLPVQYMICGTRFFDLFTVFLPVYGFLVLPIVSALADDPRAFLERNLGLLRAAAPVKAPAVAASAPRRRTQRG